MLVSNASVDAWAEQVLPVIHKFFKPVDWHSRNPVGAHSTTNNFADKLGPSELPPIQRRSLKDCIVVGDSVWDLLGARRANALELVCSAEPMAKRNCIRRENTAFMKIRRTYSTTSAKLAFG